MKSAGGGNVVQRSAPAKVNLALSVGPPLREGVSAGMHPIVSWMHCIDLADTVVVRAAAAERSTYRIMWENGRAAAVAGDRPEGGASWPIERDLAVRAHQLLEREAGRALPVGLEVTKRIPVGAGLGGGSSDAAAALIAVNALFSLGLSAEVLAVLALKLGSDVPFFIDAGAIAGATARPGIVSGLGERVKRVEPTAGSLVLLLPSSGCATGEVYRAFDELGSGGLRAAEVERLVRKPLTPGSPLFNDLGAAAERVAPGLAAIRRACGELLGRPVHITGSGSAMFAIAEDEAEAAELAGMMNEHLRDVSAMAIRLVPGRGG